MNKIDYVNRIDLEGKTPIEAIQILCDKLNETNVQVMHLTNEVISLRQKVQ